MKPMLDQQYADERGLSQTMTFFIPVRFVPMA